MLVAKIEPRASLDGISPQSEKMRLENENGKDIEIPINEVSLNGYAHEKYQVGEFPFWVLPDHIQNIIADTNKGLNFPMEFIGSSILFAVSVALGNSVSLEVRKGWLEKPRLYLSLVGPPGSNKSAPLEFSIQPILDKDQNSYDEWRYAKNEWDSWNTLSQDLKNGTEPGVPKLKQRIYSDITQEAVVQAMENNPSGIGIYMDELQGWISNFNRYNSGSDEQFWLTAWSGKPLSKNRASGEANRVKNPFISVGGTIQPKILYKLSKGDFMDNGFMDRILFCWPDNLLPAPLSEHQVQEQNLGNYHKVITSILRIQECGRVIKFCPKAQKEYTKWHNDINLPAISKATDLKGAFSKFNIYTARFALLLEGLRYGCGLSDLSNVSLESVKGGIALSEYFKRNTEKVYGKLFFGSPVDLLPEIDRMLFNTLPD